MVDLLDCSSPLTVSVAVSVCVCTCNKVWKAKFETACRIFVQPPPERSAVSADTFSLTWESEGPVWFVSWSDQCGVFRDCEWMLWSSPCKSTAWIISLPCQLKFKWCFFSLPYTLHSPSGTRHSIHQTHCSCTRAGATVPSCGCRVDPQVWLFDRLRIPTAGLHSNQTQTHKSLCLLNVFNIFLAKTFGL